MRKIIIPLLLIAPLMVGAHGMTSVNFSDVQDGIGMMRYLEDQSLGSELHEQMEGLMTKMIAGTLTEAEADQFVGLMNQYPGPTGMMMNRLGGFGGWGMMGGGYRTSWAGFWFWFMSLGALIWLGVGALLLVWLWKQISKK